MAPRLNIIIGSTRPGRVGPGIAKWFESFAREHGAFEPVLVDVDEFRLPIYDEPKHPRMRKYEKEHTAAWSASVGAADAYVFVTPEYNFFAPPSLINAIDFLYQEWGYKPAGVLSYGGVSGGLRAAQMLRLLLTTVRVMPIPDGVLVHVRQLIDETGNFTPNEMVEGTAKTMLDELLRWAEALKPLRTK